MNIRLYDHSYHEIVSGGDVIVAEFAKVWKHEGHSIQISTHQEGAEFFRSRGLPVQLVAVAAHIRTTYSSVLLGSVAHLINAVISATVSKDAPADIIFAGSCSLQDLLPAIIDKIKHRKAKLAVGCYIFLLPPWKKSYGSNTINRYLFWAEYQIGILLTRVWADVIWTASPVDQTNVIKYFRKPAEAIRGGVDLDAAQAAVRTQHSNQYDAVYLGRFHPQKNILELIDIWKIVVTKLPQATLALAGAGFLKKDLEERIRTLNLTRSVTLLPPIDGKEKFQLFTSSKLFISASHYDTGNLAMDEAMACGIPGVTYNLPKLSYPFGVVRIPQFDTALFANAIVDLISDGQKRQAMGNDARKFAGTISWDSQARRALKTINNKE